jgi:hypothetical protein
LQIHITDIYLAEELEALGVNRFELMRRLKTEGDNLLWKQKGSWLIISRESANELYPHLNIPEGLLDLFGDEWENYIPISDAEKYGVTENDIRNRYDHMPDQLFEIYEVHSNAKRIKTENGYTYIVTPSFIETVKN